MNNKRNSFLTEAMGECWHEWGPTICEFKAKCQKCGKVTSVHYFGQFFDRQGIDFSTWESFGKLWTWAIDQEWFYLMMAHHGCGPVDIVNPELFADEVYKFLLTEDNHEML